MHAFSIDARASIHRYQTKIKYLLTGACRRYTRLDIGFSNRLVNWKIWYRPFQEKEDDYIYKKKKLNDLMVLLQG